MKLLSIIVVFTLNVIVKGWVTYLQPIVLSIGAALTALYHDVEPILDIKPIKLPKWLTVHKNSMEDDDDDDGERVGVDEE